MKYFLSLLFVAFFVASCVQDEPETGWTQWRGPNANGTIVENGWHFEKLDSSAVIWLKEIGFGHSAIATLGDQCFVSGWNETINAADTAGTSSIYCFDIASGNEVWSYSYPSSKRSYPGPRATPVIDENRLYATSWEGKLFCLDISNGTELWSKALVADSITVDDQWGFNPSAVIYGDLLLINKNQSGIALDKFTGEVIWTSPRTSSHYCSVQLIKWQGQDVGVFMADSTLRFVDPMSGDVLYSYLKKSEKGMENDVMITDDGHLFTSNELIKMEGDHLSQVWVNDTVSSAFRTGVIKDGFAFQFSNHKNKFDLHCVDLATGKSVWSKDLGRWGGLSLVNDKLVILTGLGKVIIAEATPDSYSPLAELQVFDDKNKSENWCWTAPTLIDGKIFVRNSKGQFACIDLSE